MTQSEFVTWATQMDNAVAILQAAEADADIIEGNRIVARLLRAAETLRLENQQLREKLEELNDTRKLVVQGFQVLLIGHRNWRPLLAAIVEKLQAPIVKPPAATGGAS